MVASRIIKIFSIAVLATFLVSSVEPTGDSDSKCPGKQSLAEGKKETYIVMLKKDNGANKAHLKMMQECYNLRVQKVMPNSEMHITDSKDKENVLQDFSVEGSMQGYHGSFTESFIKTLSKMDCVDIVEKDKKVKITYAIPQKRAVDNNPKTKNIDRIDQAKGFDGKFVFPDTAGKGVNIFVIDTGVRITHSEFNGRAKVGASFCAGCNDNDENGHGTHVSSIAAGKTLGVARAANIVAVRVLDAKGAGQNTDVINGMAFVVDQHKKAKNKNSVVNMSLGGGFSAAVNSAVKDLTDAGVHVVVAAGNDAEDACKSSPASEPSAITVGATELNNDQITDFSNIGKCLDVFAPGRDIEGAGIGNDNDLATFSGTSQASPHVAGTVALIIAKDGNKTPDAMAKELNDLSTKGVVKGLGKGDPDSFVRVPAP